MVARLAALLPTVVLTNGTLFNDARLAALAGFDGLPVSIQVSLDSDEPTPNDAARGPGNFSKVVEATRLVDAGLRVRVATTIDGTPDPRRWPGCACCTAPSAYPTPTMWCALWCAGAGPACEARESPLAMPTSRPSSRSPQTGPSGARSGRP